MTVNNFLHHARKPEGAFGALIAQMVSYGHAGHYSRLLQLLDIGPGVRVLEFGCGAGTNIPEVTDTGASYVGVDHSPIAIAIAEQVAPEALFIVGDVQSIDLPVCDVAFCVNVIQWLDSPLDALKNVYRSLAPGGAIAIYSPDADCDAHFRDASFRLYTGDELAAMILLAGFQKASVAADNAGELRFLIGKGSK